MPYNVNTLGIDPVTSVRFWLQDTSTTAPLLVDAEIQYLIDAVAGYSADPILIASIACSVVASKYAKVANISIDGGSITTADLFNRMQTLAEQLRRTYSEIHGSDATPYAGGVELYDFAAWGARPPMFAIGANDYPGVEWSASLESYNDGELGYYGSPSVYP